MTRLVIEGQMTASQIMERYGIKNLCVNNWVSRYRKGSKRRSASGRPRVLDCQALGEIKQLLDQDPANMFNREELRNRLSEAYDDTRHRYLQGEDTNLASGYEKARTISYGTLYNYLEICQTNIIHELHAEC